LLKFFSSKEFILHSEQKQNLPDSQGGSCNGRCAINLAINKVNAYKIAETMQLQVIIIDNNVTACFDQIIWHAYNMEQTPNTLHFMPKLKSN